MKHSPYIVAGLVALISACAAEPDVGSVPEPFVYDHSLNAVKGRYAQDDLALDFSFENERGAQRFTLSARDGTVLFTSVVEGGIDTATILEHYTSIDTSAQSPRFTGEALADLAAMPEMRLLTGLRTALATSGIDSHLSWQVELCPTVTPKPEFDTSNVELENRPAN